MSSNFVYSLVREVSKRSAFDIRFDSLVAQSDGRATNVELQHLSKWGGVQLLTGLRRLDAKDVFVDQSAEISNESSDAYVYGTWNSDRPRISVQMGLAYDNLKVTNTVFPNPVKRHRLNPKLGIVWSPLPDTTVRFAAFSSVKRRLIGNQTIEPTQFAGFNQYFTGFDALYGDRDGTISERACVGFDQKLSASSFFGAELTARRMSVPSFIFERDFRWKENTAGLYFYNTQPWLAQWSLATTAELEFERIERPAILTDTEGIRSLRTYYAPFGLKAFSERGWSINVSASYVRQSGTFQLDEGFPEFPKKVRGWIGDVSVDYRLTRRIGILSLGAKNMFDKRIDLFQTDPVNPKMAPGRIVFIKARFTL